MVAGFDGSSTTSARCGLAPDCAGIASIVFAAGGEEDISPGFLTLSLMMVGLGGFAAFRWHELHMK